MNGSAFGGLAEGLAGGMSNTMSLMNLAQKKKDKAAPVSSDVSGEKMGLQDTPEPEGGDIVSDSWSTLKGIVGGPAGGTALGYHAGRRHHRKRNEELDCRQAARRRHREHDHRQAGRR